MASGHPDSLSEPIILRQEHKMVILFVIHCELVIEESIWLYETEWSKFHYIRT